MKTERKLHKKIFSGFGSVLLAALILLIIYFTYCNVTGRVAFVGDRAFIRIVSASMEPTIPTGEYIIVEKISADEISQLKKNDVIVFYSRDPQIYGKLNTHRIIDIIDNENGLQFVTKGDNNEAKDQLLTSPGDVVGRYIKNSAAITSFANFFSNKAAFFLLILIPAAALLVISIIDVVKKSKAVKMDLLVEQEIEKLRLVN